MIALLFAIVGLLLGSAVWVVGRAQAAERPLFAGPACAGCGRGMSRIGWLPFHGLGQTAHCFGCGAGQPAGRLLFEALVALYAAAAARQLGVSLELAAALAFALPLLVILLVDAWTHYIYTAMIVAGTALGLGFALLDGGDRFAGAALAGLGAAAFFAVGYAIAKLLYGERDEAPMGPGDIYLAAMIGAMTGFPGILQALTAGVFLAAAVGIVLMVSRRAERHDAMAYGSFLCLGGLLTLIFPG